MPKDRRRPDASAMERRRSRIPDMPAAHARTVFQRILAWLRSPTTRDVLTFVEMIALPAAIVTLWLTYQQIQLSNDSMRLQRITSGWQLLGSAGATAGGKAFALQTLIEDGQTAFVGLEIGCPEDSQLAGHSLRIDSYAGGQRKAAECIEAPILDGFQWRGQQAFQNIAEGVDLQINQSVELARANFRGVTLRNFTIDRVRIANSNFEAAALYNGQILNADIIGTTFERGSTQLRFENSEITSTSFRNIDPFSWLIFKDSYIGSADFSRSTIFDGTVTFTGSKFGYADFTGRNLRSIRFLDYQEGVKPHIAYAPTPTMSVVEYELFGVPENYSENLAYQPVFNISGATVCQPIAPPDALSNEYDDFNSEEIVCADLPADFFDHAWFFEDNPPIGLTLLPAETLVRQGCPTVRSDTSEVISLVMMTCPPNFQTAHETPSPQYAGNFSFSHTFPEL